MERADRATGITNWRKRKRGKRWDSDSPITGTERTTDTPITGAAASGVKRQIPCTHENTDTEKDCDRLMGMEENEKQETNIYVGSDLDAILIAVGYKGKKRNKDAMFHLTLDIESAGELIASLIRATREAVDFVEGCFPETAEIASDNVNEEDKA